MKLYKYRSFERFDYIEDILTKGRFHLSQFHKLNDPMEGYFYHIVYQSNENYKEKVKKFINDKNKLRICSFSKSLKNILLWTNYANNHKGIAIEITLNKSKYSNLFQVKYGKSIPELNFDKDPSPFAVLEKKVKIWSYEKEFRLIDEEEYTKVGTITGVYLGVNIDPMDRIKITNLMRDKKIIYSMYINFEKNEVDVLKNYNE